MKAGTDVEDIFVLSAKNLAQKRDGNPYLQIELADKTGHIKGVVWDHIEEINARVTTGDHVRAKGAISEYKGQLQFVVKQMRPCEPEGFDPADFLPATARNVDRMLVSLQTRIDAMADDDYRRLLKAFFEDSDIVERIKQAPAAKKMHHAYLGGLLEHTLSMVLLADQIAGHYSGVDRDLLIAGAVLHDIGKIRELAYQSAIDYTDEGRLVSHIVIAAELIDRKLATLGEFPPEKAVLIKHLVISHHGSRSLGSPEPPKTIEAVLLNYIDEMDAKVNAIREFSRNHPTDGNWTPYHRLLERHFYKGKP